MDNRRPLVSILMAAYRAADTILAALASVRGQTHENWELIIASDCGTDYLDLCNANGMRDRRIRMVPTGGRGLGAAAARNAALAAAGGSFITILDSDDIWLPKRLAALLPLAAAHGLACDNTAAVTPGGKVIATAHPVGQSPRQIDALTMLASGMPHFPLFRREFAGTGYRPDLRFAEDVAFNIELIARSGAMMLLPQPFIHYIQRPASATNAPDAWRRAEAAYEKIICLLWQGAITVPTGQRAEIIDAMAAKRRLNLAYGAAVTAGGSSSFQSFLATRRFGAE